jgi:uncharacterized zinc-type alcohol dehydrogenase-like protein
MLTVKALSVAGPQSPFERTTIERRDPGATDVVIDIAYCGVCQTDIQYAHSKGVATRYPLVPGHEIAGTVAAVGADVIGFGVGDRVGVGCMVGSCGRCDRCAVHLEQFCREDYVRTYGGLDHDGSPTAGGYSERIVVEQNFVVAIPDVLPLESAAPLMCAGITMYSPLRHWQAGPGKHVAIVGFGGLGHVGVQLAKAMGAHTTVLDLSLDKEGDGLRLGADEYHAVAEASAFKRLEDSFDLIISTVPARLDMLAYLNTLKLDGTMVQLGASTEPLSVPAGALRAGRRSVAGTRIGGMAETQEAIDFCAQHGVTAEVEVIPADYLDRAYERVLAGDVRFRFVLDIATLA